MYDLRFLELYIIHFDFDRDLIYGTRDALPSPTTDMVHTLSHPHATKANAEKPSILAPFIKQYRKYKDQALRLQLAGKGSTIRDLAHGKSNIHIKSWAIKMPELVAFAWGNDDNGSNREGIKTQHK